MVCVVVLAGLFAFLAPLALLVFVPPVAVTLLAVMSPPAAAAAGHEKDGIGKSTGNNNRRVFRKGKRIKRVETKREREENQQARKRGKLKSSQT